jgi:hypothetical protein
LTGGDGVILWKISCNHLVMERNHPDFDRIILGPLHEKSRPDHEHSGISHTIYYATLGNYCGRNRPILAVKPLPGQFVRSVNVREKLWLSVDSCGQACG